MEPEAVGGRRTDVPRIQGALAAVAGLLLGACAGDGALAPDVLEGRTFLSTVVLEEGVERPLVPGTRVELSFADGMLTARAGCNIMGAEYELEDGVLRLVGGVGTTEMGCDPELHEQDEWISAVLGGSPNVALEGSELLLVSGETEIRLLDREVADPDRPLEGTLWHLESIVEGEVVSSVPEGLAPTLDIRDDGTVVLDTGCNEGSGTVEVEPGTLTFRSVVVTQRECGRDDQDAAEARILGVLRGQVSYTIDGRVLSLRVGDLGLDWRA